MATDADALPRIDKRYGEKCAALLWQLSQQNELAQEQQQSSTAATRKSALAVKYGITVPKSAGYRGSTATAAVTGGCALFTMKQQRPSSTRAAAKKSGANMSLEQATRPRFSSSRAFGSGVEDDQMQLQQLEAANSDPIQAFRSPRSSGNRSRFVETSLTELDVVRGENENLRLEIAVLHEKLMEKMRGGSKIVAGGQFRGKVMASGAKNAQSPAPPANCSMCATLRLDLKRGRHEFTHNQHIIEELHREIEKLEAIQHTLWAENSSYSQEMRDLREQIDEFQQAQGARDDRIRELEQLVLLKQAQEAENNPEASCNSSPGSSITNSATQCSPLPSPRVQLNDELAQRNATLEEEVTRLKLQLATHGLELKNTSKLWHEAQLELDQEKRAHDASCLKLRACEEHYRQQLSQLKQMLATAQGDLTKVQECKATEERQIEVLNETSARLLAQLQTRCDTANRLEETNRTLRGFNQTLQAQVNESQVRTSSTSNEVLHVTSQLREAQGGNLQLASVNRRLQSELQDHVRQIFEYRQQIQEMQTHARAIEVDKATWEQQNEALDAQMTERSTQLQEFINTLKTEQQHLQAQVSALEWESARNEAFMLKLKNSHTLALEQALQSTIRLCVVAPTVNVHLSETTRTLSSSSLASSGSTPSELVVCKPAPPHERIRNIVENEILPHFTRLIVQEVTSEEEMRTSGRDGATVSIEPWISDLLLAMQKKITEQLQSVYQTTGA